MRRERRKQTKGRREQRDAILLWSHWKDKQVHYNVSKSAVRFNITERPQSSAHASVCRDTLQCDCVLWTGLIRTLLLQYFRQEVMLSKNENGSKFIFFFHAQIRFRLTLMLHVCPHTASLLEPLRVQLYTSWINWMLNIQSQQDTFISS